MTINNTSQDNLYFSATKLHEDAEWIFDQVNTRDEPAVITHGGRFMAIIWPPTKSVPSEDSLPYTLDDLHVNTLRVIRRANELNKFARITHEGAFMGVLQSLIDEDVESRVLDELAGDLPSKGSAAKLYSFEEIWQTITKGEAGLRDEQSAE